MDPFKKLLTELLSKGGDDGWMPSHYVVCVGIERMVAGGRVETATYWVCPDEQAEYVSDGLMEAVQQQRNNAEVEG